MRKQGPRTGQHPGLRLNAWWLIGCLVALAVVLLVSACGTPQAEMEPTATQAAAPTATRPRPPLRLPGYVLTGSQKVQSAYIVATLHAEELEYIPCYCSCGSFGHSAVIDCFIAGTDATGAPLYDNHAYY